jgi:hypothetical protein
VTILVYRHTWREVDELARSSYKASMLSSYVFIEINPVQYQVSKAFKAFGNAKRDSGILVEMFSYLSTLLSLV